MGDTRILGQSHPCQKEKAQLKSHHLQSRTEPVLCQEGWASEATVPRANSRLAVWDSRSVLGFLDLVDLQSRGYAWLVLWPLDHPSDDGERPDSAPSGVRVLLKGGGLLVYGLHFPFNQKATYTSLSTRRPHWTCLQRLDIHTPSAPDSRRPRCPDPAVCGNVCAGSAAHVQ